VATKTWRGKSGLVYTETSESPVKKRPAATKGKAKCAVKWRKPDGHVEESFSCTHGSEASDGREIECQGRCNARPVVAVNDGCGARCASHAPSGFGPKKRPARKPAKWSRLSTEGYVCTRERCLHQASWRSPYGSFLCEPHAKEERKPARKPAKFARWRAGVGYIDYDGIKVLACVDSTVALRAAEIARALNRARVVVHARKGAR